MRVGPLYLFALNKTSKTFGADGLLKSFQLGGVAFGNQLDATVGQVADDASKLKTGRDGLNSVSKTNALNAS